MNDLSGAFIGSLIGAVVGCAAWIGVGLATGYELGILAVLVGLAVGIGAALGAKGRAGTAGGVMAAAVAIAGIVAARYVLVQSAIDKHIAEARAEFSDEIPGPEDAEYWTAFIADRIVREREDNGEDIDWPYLDEDEEDNVAASYPTDIWMEAQRKWAGIPLADRDDFCATATASMLEGDVEDFRAVAGIIGVVVSNFHPMALIIMGIAATGAYRTAKHSRPVNEGEAEGEIVQFANTLPTAGPGAKPAMQMPSSMSTNVSNAPPPAAAATSPQTSKPVRTYTPAAIDESQLPPQFRARPTAGR
jgi:hypothetical protein